MTMKEGGWRERSGGDELKAGGRADLEQSKDVQHITFLRLQIRRLEMR